MATSTRKSGFAALEQELHTERAGALARLGDTIERLLAQLAALERSLPTEDGPRVRALAEHERLRAEAERYVWYLVVTREAIGLRRHDDVYEQYPVPRRLAPH